MTHELVFGVLAAAGVLVAIPLWVRDRALSKREAYPAPFTDREYAGFLQRANARGAERLRRNAGQTPLLDALLEEGDA